MILQERSIPEFRLTIFNYSINLFENPDVHFQLFEINSYINKLSELEDYINLGKKLLENEQIFVKILPTHERRKIYLPLQVSAINHINSFAFKNN